MPKTNAFSAIKRQSNTVVAARQLITKRAYSSEIANAMVQVSRTYSI